MREGADAAVKQYRELRGQYYGRGTYDFGEDTLLTVARRLYERAGFRLVKTERHRSFGKALVGQTWELDLRESRAPGSH